jgi:hypothetical protein
MCFLPSGLLNNAIALIEFILPHPQLKQRMVRRVPGTKVLAALVKDGNWKSSKMAS